MSSEGKFWLGFVAIIAVVLIIVIGGAQMYYANKNATLAAMVKAGADPIKAACALESNHTPGEAAICAIAATPRFPSEF